MSVMPKCRCCGDTEFTDLGNNVLQCRSCRHKMAKPKQNPELLARANNLLFETKDFDGAGNMYEQIIRITPEEAEAYWGRVLCRFGIEYVKDVNGKYLPTCHRTIEGSILDDADYKMVLLKAEPSMIDYYIGEANTIDEYQRKIKVISSKEEPYDVFISFKATDDYGNPTEDSLIAQDIYYYLTKNLKLKVFFSNVTLKDKAGQEYEPIIYAALTSATVMVLVGTRADFVVSTWVKNEWSRYCKMADNASSAKPKYIISALKGMKPDQLPTELASRQAIDIGELGAKEKLCSNIDSLIGDLRVMNTPKTAAAPAVPNLEQLSSEMTSHEANNLCNLAYQHLENSKFDEASKMFDEALKKNYSLARAYFGKVMAAFSACSEDMLAGMPANIRGDDYRAACKYASKEERARWEKICAECDLQCELDVEIQRAKQLKQEVDEQKDDELDDPDRTHKIWQKEIELQQLKSKKNAQEQKESMGVILPILMAICSIVTIFLYNRGDDINAVALIVMLVAMLGAPILLGAIIGGRIIDEPFSIAGGVIGLVGTLILAVILPKIVDISPYTLVTVCWGILLIIGVLLIIIRIAAKVVRASKISDYNKRSRIIQEEISELKSERNAYIAEHKRNRRQEIDKELAADRERIIAKYREKYGNEVVRGVH